MRLRRKPPRRELKLMSFNIRYYKPGVDGDNCWENRREGVLKMLRAEDPDIIGFRSRTVRRSIFSGST